MKTSQATAGKCGPNQHQRKGGTAIGGVNAGVDMNHHDYVTQGEMKSMILELLKGDKESMRVEMNELKGNFNVLEEKFNASQKSKEEASYIESDDHQLLGVEAKQGSSSAAKKRKNRHNKSKKKGNNKQTNYRGGDNVGSLTKVTVWASTWKIGVGFISIAVLGSIAFGQGIVGQSYPFVWGQKGVPPAKNGGHAPTNNVNEAESWEEELLVVESIDKGVNTITVLGEEAIKATAVLEKEEAKAVAVVKNEAADRYVRGAIKEDQTQEEKSSSQSKNNPNLNLVAGSAGRRRGGDSSMIVSAVVASDSFDGKPPPSLQKRELSESVAHGKLEKIRNSDELNQNGVSSKPDHTTTTHATKTLEDAIVEVEESPPSLRKRNGRHTSVQRDTLPKAVRPSKTTTIEEGVTPVKVLLSDEVGGVAPRTLQGNVSPAATTIDEEDSLPTATAIEEDDSSLETSNLFSSSVTPASPSSTLLLLGNNDVATIIPTSLALFAATNLPTTAPSYGPIESNTAFHAGIVFTPDYVCDANPEECGCPNLLGVDYRGSLSKTKDGRECIKWGTWWIENDPYDGLEKNFCRNPDGSTGGPWCYTAESNEDGHNWGNCDVPVCTALTTPLTTSSIPTSPARPTGSPSSSFPPSSSSSPTQICPVADNEMCGCANIGQADYRGTKSTTKEGFDCVRWDSDWVKGLDSFILEDYSDAGLEGNFCRNPENNFLYGPWCYTNFPNADGKYYKYCDIPSCDPRLCMPPCGEPNDSAYACPSVFQADRCCGKEDASVNCKCGHLKDACRISLENNSTDFCDDAEAACCGVEGEDTHNPNCKCNMYEQICSENPSQSTCDHAAGSCCESWNFQCFCDFYTYTEDILNERSEYKSGNCSKADAWQTRTLSEEREDLKDLYEETGGDYWNNSSGWLNDRIPQCQWFGLKCDEDGLVVEINLRNNNLTGEDFFRNLWLPQLTKLDVAGNKLLGKVESVDIQEYHRQLVYIDISDNHFSGEVDMSFPPSTLHVNYSHNNLTSVGFKRFNQAYETLRVIDLSNNGINQDASSLFVNIPPHIEELSLSNNAIQGTLPDPFPLENVKTLSISNNALHGPLPNFPSPQLEKLDLSKQNKRENGGLTGGIPTALSKLGELTELNLAGNKLANRIPSVLGNLQYLKVLDVSSNALAGPIPSELGKLTDVLKVLDLSSNKLTGTIPLELANLEGALADLLLRGNLNISTPAPLDLCYLPCFDLVNDTRFCPPERNTLRDFYVSAKGGEWTESKLWLDPVISHCNWTGVTCEVGNVTKLELPNNGLSGKLTKDISKLTLLEVLDLSDNDIKGEIPTEIGLLSNLTKLFLRYNNFVGGKTDLGKLQNLEVVHLHGNRLSGTISSLGMSLSDSSSFVSDCGYPSDFDKSLDCDNCTMCCNAQGDCYPTEKTPLKNAGFENYMQFTFVFLAFLIAIFGVLALALYARDKYQHLHLEESSIGRPDCTNRETKCALQMIGKNSVYQVCFGKSWSGWIILLLTLAAQLMLLFVFVESAEIDWTKETSALVYTWKCPRDQDECENKNDRGPLGWLGFGILMIAFLLKDIIKGIRLIVLSAKKRHRRQTRMKYFLGGMLLITMSAFALYVSIIYNVATATDDKEVIENAVIILFVNDIDEQLHDLLMAVSQNWVDRMTLQEEEQGESANEIDSQERDDEEDVVERDSPVQTSQTLPKVDQSEVIRKLENRVEDLEKYVGQLTLQLNKSLTMP